MAGNVSTIQKCKVVLIGDNASSPNASIQYRYPRCPLSQKRMREGEFDGVFDHNQIEVDEGDIIFGMCDSDFPDDKSDTWDVGKISDEEPEQAELAKATEWGINSRLRKTNGKT